MEEHDPIELTFSNAGTRNEVRMRVVDAFANEEAGTGKERNVSRYTYVVETIGDLKIILRRPGAYYKGFDFVVRVLNYNFSAAGKRRRFEPKHDDIIKDLRLKKNNDENEYARLYSILKRVYSCEDVADEELRSFHFTTGMSVELIAKVLKWLLIEQDIRGWNYSGRNMLWNGIPTP